MTVELRIVAHFLGEAAVSTSAEAAQALWELATMGDRTVES